MIWIVLSLLSAAVIGFILGVWLTIGHYERQRCMKDYWEA